MLQTASIASKSPEEDISHDYVIVSPTIPPFPPCITLKPVILDDSVHSLLDISAPRMNSPTSTRNNSQCPTPIKKSASSSLDLANPSTFGSRLLADPSKIMDHNAWDHVEWDDTLLSHAAERVAFQNAHPVPDTEIQRYADTFAHSFWDEFYAKHDKAFFKDRKWINIEFPELIDTLRPDAGPKVIADIGCAVGNTVYPLLAMNKNPALIIHALDFSASAIEILKQNPGYDVKHVTPGVWDIADVETSPSHITPGTVDVVVLIFAFSALSPAQWSRATANLSRLLKPGGLVLLRDYGRFDLTQLRLKAGRCLADNFYIRGDGTRVYYFTNEELASIFSGWEVIQNAVDKRLLVNRKEEKKMYRCWVQAKFRKPLVAPCIGTGLEG